MNHPAPALDNLNPRRRSSELQVRTQASVLTDAIREDIIQGVFPPESKLKLRELAERYEVGVIPLREALSRLAMSGFVEAEDQRGFRVASVSRAELLDITRVRQKIETEALRDAIAHGDLNWEAAILAALYRLDRIPLLADGATQGINPEWERAHEDFHTALLAACTSSWQLKLSVLLREQTARYRHLSVQREKSSSRDVGSEHRAIADAVIARDADKACALLQLHFAATTELVLKQA